MAAAATTRARTARRPVSRGRSALPARAGVRWDRLGRLALLIVLAVILLLYASPLKSWVAQKQTSAEYSTELRSLEADNVRLKARAKGLTRPDAIEREARRLGMVRKGERAYVIEKLPR